MSALKYWLWLTTRRGMDAASALAVLDCFVTPERAYYADEEDLCLLPLRPAARKGMLDKSLDRADEILGECQRLGIRVMTFQDADYPQRLRQIAQPPAVLYWKGRSFHFDEEAAKSILSQDEVIIDITLHEGKEEATCWGCDLTYDYVRINGDYRT